MLEFKKNELINEVLLNYYNTFQITLDTNDYVPQAFRKKISRYLYRNMRSKFWEADKKYRQYRKSPEMVEDLEKQILLKSLSQSQKVDWLLNNIDEQQFVMLCNKLKAVKQRKRKEERLASKLSNGSTAETQSSKAGGV